MLRVDKAQPNFGLSENMVQLIENIRELKNQPIKNEAHVNFDVSENINQPKFGLVKNDYLITDVNGAQVIENKVQSNFTFNGFFIETTYWKH